jgi:hypothetical protein
LNFTVKQIDFLLGKTAFLEFFIVWSVLILFSTEFVFNSELFYRRGVVIQFWALLYHQILSFKLINWSEISISLYGTASCLPFLLKVQSHLLKRLQCLLAVWMVFCSDLLKSDLASFCRAGHIVWARTRVSLWGLSLDKIGPGSFVPGF